MARRDAQQSFPLKRIQAANTSVLDFWPPELRENTFLLFEGICLWSLVMAVPHLLPKPQGVSLPWGCPCHPARRGTCLQLPVPRLLPEEQGGR